MESPRRPTSAAAPLSPSRSAQWYGEFCLLLGEQLRADEEVSLETVRVELAAFLARLGIRLPKKHRDTLARRVQFELNLPAQVRSRAYSV